MKNRFLDSLVSGFALFSMFFGAGNLVWPIFLGATTGEMAGTALVGFLLTAALFPLVGLLGIMLYKGNQTAFFSRIGKWPGRAFLTLVYLILGPFGAIPRLITLSHAIFETYVPGLSLPLFSIIACVLLFLMMYQRDKIVPILGWILTPILLVSLGLVIVGGLIGHPTAESSTLPSGTAFWEGLTIGYNTMDLLASLLFGTLIYGYFQKRRQGTESLVPSFLRASVTAIVLLALSYGGLCLVSSFHTVAVDQEPQRLVANLATAILGPFGGLVAATAIAMACLTTALSLAALSAEAVQKIRGNWTTSLALVLVLSGLFANLGFVRIAEILTPVMNVCYPGLIVLCLFNIGYKLGRKETVPSLPIGE